MKVDFFKNHPAKTLVLDMARVLNEQGYQAVLAGGSVRDALLGIDPQDLDMATDATPEVIESLFAHVVPVGKSFGVCRVVEHGQQVEVATFREESEYQDGRHPEKVVFSTLEKDAERRDFTINAMFYDLKTHAVIDLVGGQEDLKKGLIKTVGNPEQRFSEDYLRILRGARFAAQLGFAVDGSTAQAMKKMASGISKISQERIQEECHKAFKSRQPFRFFEEGKSAGILPLIFFKELWSDSSLWSHFQKFFATALSEPAIGWAELGLYFLRLSNNNMAAMKDFFKDKKLSNQIIQQIQDILAAEVFLTEGRLEDFVALVKSPHLALIETFWQREEMAKSGTEKFKEKVQAFKAKYFKNGILPLALVRGDDLKVLGLKGGPAFKDFLDTAYLYQLENPNCDKIEILKQVKKLKS